LADDSEADRAEVLAVALADPEAALISFRALVAENRAITVNLRPPSSAPADMRPCVDCLNLSPGGRCLAAWRRESFGPGIAVSREWRPALTDRPQRCAPYRPGPNDPDKRTGAERWPFLLEARR
jgi:hypothetical protein